MAALIGIEDTEYYNNPDELLLEEDIVETDVRILGWNKKFRIRALTFGQMERINQRSLISETNKEEGKIAGELDNTEWTIWTIVEGVVRPKFNSIKARKLIEKNGEFVKELADQIWGIGRVNKAMFEAYVDEQKRLVNAEKGIPDEKKSNTDSE